MDYTWSRSTRYTVLLIGLLLGALITYATRDLLRPLIISGLLAYVLNPAVELLLARTRTGRSLASLIVYFLALAIVIAVPAITTPVVIRQLTGLTLDLQRIQNQVEFILSEPITIGGIDVLPNITTVDIGQLITDAVAPAASNAWDFLGGLTTNLLWILLILVTTYYLLRDGPRISTWFVRLAPERLQSDIERLFFETDYVWSAYLRGQLTLSLIIGVLTAIVTAAVGLPGALVLGLLAGILDVIPSLGPTVAGAISVVVALFLGSTYLPLSNLVFGLIVLAVFIVIQQIENIWLRPQIMGHSLSIHPAIVFVSVLSALAIVGVLGALVIIPVVATLGLVGRYIHSRLLSKDPWSGVEDRRKESTGEKKTAQQMVASTEEPGRI